MPLVTDAIVLHAFDYLESSRILKLATRHGGLRSVLARGMRKSTKRFGAALDLFAQGTAEVHAKAGRELDTLSAFDVTRARPQLAADLGRFTGAGAIAELALRFGHGSYVPDGGDDNAGDTDDGLFDAIADAFDRIAVAPADRARDITLMAAWRVLSQLGVAPSVDHCVECHDEVDPTRAAMFSHPAGGVLCARCAHLARSGRTIPADARDALRDWLAGNAHALHDAHAARAHQRLLREFLREHLADERQLRAYDVWASGTWTTPVRGGAAGAPA
ncbi:MAG TPA: DNA repair protein RecO [Gemmatimonadaceae bacterium]|jgi:DNA repair protein RecO (recombination protein O)|nr:DNA repair protein RecO [Gemmatimonadaceae bacterium]